MGKSTVFFLLTAVHFHSFNAQHSKICAPSSCGNLRNISYPFRLTGDPENCGFSDYELSCENNKPILHLYNGTYTVISINYSDSSVRIVDSNVNQTNCSAVPRNSLTGANFSYFDPYSWHPLINGEPNRSLQKLVVFLTCDNPVNSDGYIETAPSINGSYSYVIDNFTSVAQVEDSCTVELMAWSLSPARVGRNVSFVEIHDDLAFGFEIWWIEIRCEICRNGDSFCRRVNGFLPIVCFDVKKGYELLILVAIGAIIVARFVCGAPFVVAFLAYTWSRRHTSMYNSIEEFLQGENNLAPVRYKYSQIKKMTNGFKDKLGEGGFGSVYKAKLRSGRFAAIKMLGNSKSNGQDFINEVSSIGRVYHVNVVRLIGFCAEGSKRALVYDFMPNGSLDKYVFSQQGNLRLSWKQMHEISLGVARGIDYLHRGCEMQILHFDIKPHNILLDENFIPKVSDFGLAKLRSISDTTLTLTAARGTIGYIAPELFYKNIGGISYKADVYSFGMLLLEVVGKKKNRNADAENSSQIYFPNWVYNEVVDGKISVNNAVGGEEKLVKKMVKVALWCIQMKPSDRPSMSKVVEMLEGDLESITLPPKPSLYPEEKPMRFEDEIWSSSMFVDSSDSITLLENSY